MRLISILLLSFLFSRNSSEEENEKPFPDPSFENPWTYINRISDTLPETEFSLFNSREKNLQILNKYKQDELDFRYRIGQNKYLMVTANSVLKWNFRCYVMGAPFVIHFNDDGSYYIPDEGLIIQKENIDTISVLYEKSITETYHDSRDSYGSYFKINCNPDIEQTRINKILDLLENGYWAFLNNKKNKFESQTEQEKNEMLKKYPFAMLYEFYWTDPYIEADSKQ